MSAGTNSVSREQMSVRISRDSCVTTADFRIRRPSTSLGNGRPDFFLSIRFFSCTVRVHVVHTTITFSSSMANRRLAAAYIYVNTTDTSRPRAPLMAVVDNCERDTLKCFYCFRVDFKDIRRPFVSRSTYQEFRPRSVCFTRKAQPIRVFYLLLYVSDDINARFYYVHDFALYKPNILNSRFIQLRIVVRSLIEIVCRENDRLEIFINTI